MLLESAFLKLPELMLASYEHQGNVEAMVVQHFATGIQMELNSRSIPFSYNHVTIEKPYPNQNRRGTVFRSDLLFDAIGSVPNISRLDQYGFKEKQWLEAKSFFGRNNSSPAKTQNIGRIVKDIVRLCLLPEELQGSIRQNGRYVLLVFDSHPRHYLAFSDRDWLKAIFDEIKPTLSVDLSSEKKTLVKSIVNCDSVDAQIEVDLSNHYFEPTTETPSPVYWGYLLRINNFKMSINGKHIGYSSIANDNWDANRIEKLQLVKEEFTKLLKGDEGDITS